MDNNKDLYLRYSSPQPVSSRLPHLLLHTTSPSSYITNFSGHIYSALVELLTKLTELSMDTERPPIRAATGVFT